jgi:hypothetical protein
MNLKQTGFVICYVSFEPFLTNTTLPGPKASSTPLVPDTYLTLFCLYHFRSYNLLSENQTRNTLNVILG